MEQPPLQYVRTPDGFDIAYSVGGEGPPLVIVPSVLAQVSGSWRRFPDWFETLSSRFTVVQYDSRGQGLSRRGLPAALTRQDLMRDLVTVVDHLQLPRFVLYASGGFGHVALDYAMAHPERLTGLVLHTVCIANAAWGPTLWNDLAKENWDYFLESLIPAGLPPEEHALRLQGLHDTATFEDYRALTDLLMASSVAPILDAVCTPVLVLHPRDSVMLPVRESVSLAAAVPGATFVLLSGQGYWPEAAEGVSAIERFLSGLKHPSQAKPDTTALLSTREAEVLELISRGLSNQQIADELVISVRTVERHINHIYEKLGVHSKAQATAYALRNSLA
jgi:DNA-binding CsgD family transcriptional regulator/pimeloyl-ACP methyl ester carboxylesterase